eukprot:85121-Hanusia_phi.AAC.4
MKKLPDKLYLLVDDKMVFAAQDDFTPSAVTMYHDSNQVPHGPGRDEQALGMIVTQRYHLRHGSNHLLPSRTAQRILVRAR